jgi:hypothetical protein
MGPVLLNLVYDATGSYTPALLAAIPLSLTAALLFLLLGPYPDNVKSGSDRTLIWRKAGARCASS